MFYAAVMRRERICAQHPCDGSGRDSVWRVTRERICAQHPRGRGGSDFVWWGDVWRRVRGQTFNHCIGFSLGGATLGGGCAGRGCDQLWRRVLGQKCDPCVSVSHLCPPPPGGRERDIYGWRRVYAPVHTFPVPIQCLSSAYPVPIQFLSPVAIPFYIRFIIYGA